MAKLLMVTICCIPIILFGMPYWCSKNSVDKINASANNAMTNNTLTNKIDLKHPAMEKVYPGFLYKDLDMKGAGIYRYGEVKFASGQILPVRFIGADPHVQYGPKAGTPVRCDIVYMGMNDKGEPGYILQGIPDFVEH